MESFIYSYTVTLVGTTFGYNRTHQRFRLTFESLNEKLTMRMAENFEAITELLFAPQDVGFSHARMISKSMVTHGEQLENGRHTFYRDIEWEVPGCD
jgi:hypothetical protein